MAKSLLLPESLCPNAKICLFPIRRKAASEKPEDSQNVSECDWNDYNVIKYACAE